MTENLASNQNLKRRRTWRALRATDFESLMYPNFCVSFILGIFPYKCESSRYVFSGTRFACSSLVFFIFIIFTSVSVYQMNFGTLTFNNISRTTFTNFGYIWNGGIVVAMYILSLPRLRVLQSLAEMSQILSSKDFDDLGKLFHTKDFLSFLFVIIHLPNCFRTSVYHTMRYLVSIYMVLTCLSLDMFYMNCVCILKACFGKINEGLGELSRPTANDNTCAKNTLRDGRECSLLLVKLKYLEQKYLNISDAVQLLNATFFLHNTMLTVLTFVIVIFNAYYFILWLHGGYTVDVTAQIWYIQFLSSALHHMLKFVMIIWACETAKNQALEIGTTVHDVLGDTTDTLVKQELELFSLQILHRDNTYSAKLVTMNAALLTQRTEGHSRMFIKAKSIDE
ncbi:uncharacterized protein LOC128890604 [Hylaeus anthracinus]|uniref:uncharacterized protein LOC128890604 n=1 Tax=Hylaeus anthracinus TaxID=313031 RepID=UPI0023B92D9A|nr:uncharacterized protein LOC128890604 [Hylaeus anthracinus]